MTIPYSRPLSVVCFNYGDHRSAAVRTLMHGIDRHEYGGIPNRCGGDAADRGLCMPVMVHVRIIEHDLPAPAQAAAAVGLALDEAVHHPPGEILGARALGQRKSGIADRRVDAV